MNSNHLVVRIYNSYTLLNYLNYLIIIQRIFFDKIYLKYKKQIIIIINMSSFTYNSALTYLETEIKINIFKYVDSPLNLALTCKEWNYIAKDPYAKSEWLIYQFGKTHALFHGIRLGQTFINRD